MEAKAASASTTTVASSTATASPPASSTSDNAIISAAKWKQLATKHFRDGDFAWVPSYYEFAHCDWAQYWAETGVVGLLLLLGTPLLWFVYHLRKGRGNSITHWLGVGCVLVMILAWFEFPFGAEAVSLLFAACFTFAGKYADMSEQSRKRRKRRRRREDERLPMKETALITERS